MGDDEAVSPQGGPQQGNPPEADTTQGAPTAADDTAPADTAPADTAPADTAPADMPEAQAPLEWTRFSTQFYIDELQNAAEGGPVSLSQTYLAKWIGSEETGPDEQRQQIKDLQSRLLERFELTSGRILDSEYGDTAAAGAVLLRRKDEDEADGAARNAAAATDGNARRFGRRLATGSAQSPESDVAHAPRAGDMDAFVWWNWLHFDSTDASKLLSDVLFLRDRITTFLAGELPREKDARDIALRRLYEIARDLLAAIDTEDQVQAAGNGNQRTSAQFEQSIDSLRERLNETQANYLAALQRLAQRTYISAVFVGFLGMVVLVGLFAVATLVWHFTDGWVAAGIGGVVGAVLSVLQRMGRGLDLGPEAETVAIHQQGLARPLIGLLLGLASYVLLRGGIVSFTAPTAGADTILYYAGIAFLAGFSERFAQDMLAAPVGLKAITGDGASAPPKSG